MSALSTPSTQVMPASGMTTMLHHQAGGPLRSKTMRMKP